MMALITILHVIVAFALILIVLLQTGKGADMGAAFGGSSQTLFGSSGPASFLSKITTLVAIVFILTSLTLAYFKRESSSIMNDYKPFVEETIPGLPDIPIESGTPEDGTLP